MEMRPIFEVVYKNDITYRHYDLFESRELAEQWIKEVSNSYYKFDSFEIVVRTMRTSI